MFEPAIAPVRPRVTSPVTGDSVLLEDEVLDFVERGQSGVILLLGDRGSGKTTAMKHLAAVLPPGHRISLIDQDDNQQMPLVPEGGIAVSSRSHSPGWKFLAELRLQPWGQDECIEYLLAVSPDVCRQVAPRLTDAAITDGSPRLLRIVLDLLADDPEVPNVNSAVDRYLSRVLSTPDLRRSAGEFCLQTMYDHMQANATLQFLRACGLAPETEPVLLHQRIRVCLGAEAVVSQLVSSKRPTLLHCRLPREVAQAAGESLAADASALAGLQRLLSRRKASKTHSMAASLLRYADAAWEKAAPGPGVRLQGAYLDEVDWSGLRLKKAVLTDADFTAATLEGACLQEATMTRTVLRGANLKGATLTNSDGDDVDFTGANLSEAVLNGAAFDGADFVDADLTGTRLVGTSLVAADLTRARLRGANLSKADLHIARLERTDLTGAELCGASLVKADLRSAIVERTSFRGARLGFVNLENVNWPDVQLTAAILVHADLTGSKLHRADLRKVELAGAMLGEIDWEFADLREADLRGASFHMGSSREGLLFSPYASEGTRTGFYTDEYDEQYFKPPEEIRKANLRGCDLRGAQIEGVDFYLVDLRDALLDPDQRTYVERRGAILSEDT